MIVIISIVTVLAGLLTGYVLLKRRNRKKTDNQKNEDDNTEGTSPLDKVYDDLLNIDEATDTPNDNPASQKPKPVVMKLKDRTFWSIYKGTIISGLVIILFAVSIAIVSVLAQKSYSDRKQSEEEARKEQQAIEKEAERSRMWKEEERVLELSRQLDSIDAHIKQLSPAPKQPTKKKSGK